MKEKPRMGQGYGDRPWSDGVDEEISLGPHAYLGTIPRFCLPLTWLIALELPPMCLQPSGHCAHDASAGRFRASSPRCAQPLKEERGPP